MDKFDLYYAEPQSAVSTPTPAISIRQAVKAMIFGLVAITLAEVPFIGFFTAPIFAIISLCMGSDFKRKHPGQALGFLRPGKICPIISLPLCVFVSVVYVLNIVSLVSDYSYMYC